MILFVPVPQNPACNHLLQTPSREGEYACTLARRALGIWMDDPAGYPEAIHHLKEQGPDAARRAEADRLIAAAVDLFEASGARTVPTLLFPRAIVSGLPTRQDLRQILLRELGLRLPAAAPVPAAAAEAVATPRSKT